MYAINAVDDDGMDIDLYPYRQLWAAVMTQAIEDMRYGHDKFDNLTKKASINARWWFETEGSGFEDVCGYLGLDPKITRGRILNGQEKK